MQIFGKMSLKSICRNLILVSFFFFNTVIAASLTEQQQQTLRQSC